VKLESSVKPAVVRVNWKFQTEFVELNYLCIQVVVIDFIVFNITASSDNVYVYDGPSSQEDVVPKLVSLTGWYPVTPRGITTTQRYMLLRFTTGPQSSSATGFNAFYYSTTTGVL
jgi:hypothetical protein